MNQERFTAIINGLSIVGLVTVWIYIWRANKAFNKQLGFTKIKRKDRAK